MSSKTGPLETPTASTANNGDDNVTNNDTLNTTSSNDEETSKSIANCISKSNKKSKFEWLVGFQRIH